MVYSSSLSDREWEILDRLNFVEGYRWSPFVAAPEQLHLHPQPQDVLSILTRELKRSPFHRAS